MQDTSERAGRWLPSRCGVRCRLLRRTPGPGPRFRFVPAIQETAKMSHDIHHDQCRICVQCCCCTGYGAACCRHGEGREHDKGQECGCGKGDAGCRRCGLCQKCCASAACSSVSQNCFKSQQSAIPVRLHVLEAELGCTHSVKPNGDAVLPRLSALEEIIFGEVRGGTIPTRLADLEKSVR